MAGDYQYMVDWLNGLGYEPDTRMAGKVAEYSGWYTAKNSWYSYSESRNFDTFKIDRETLNPAAMVAQAWADLLMNEKLVISSDDEGMTNVIADHLGDFGVSQADFVTDSFALGTGGWAIGASNVSDDGMVNPDAEIVIESHGTPEVMPLTWSDNDCTQCAFASRVEVGGRDYNRCQAHVLVDGTYHIVTQLFDVKTNAKVTVESVIPDFDTRSTHPTFALVRPAIPNTHYEHCAMGVSVFERGISAVKVTDEALTSLLTHLRVSRPKMFVSETMIKKHTEKNANGDNVTIYSAFGEADDIVFRMSPGEEHEKPMTVVQPEMRIAENEQAVNAGLKMLSITCGLGDNYWQWDHKGGLKTATEVVSDSSMLARTLRKHQNALGKSITRLVRGVAGVCRGVCGRSVDPEATVTIDFDDSIITDTQTEKQLMLNEISAGVVPAWKYLTTFYGMGEKEAREAVSEGEVIDTGF